MTGREPTELRCRSCGAGLQYDPRAATAITCPYCGTEYVIGTDSEATTKPTA